MTDRDRRRYRVIETKRINAATYHLTIDGVLWSEVEWSASRQRWCVQDACGFCLTHVESIVGQDRDVQTALRLARRMIVDGRMPTPEEAKRRQQERLDDRRTDNIAAQLEEVEHQLLEPFTVEDDTSSPMGLPLNAKRKEA
jgi:hypothetical protein